MAGLDFFLGLNQLDLIVVELAGVGIADRRLDDLLEVQLAQRAALQIGEAASRRPRPRRAFLFGGFGEQLVVDQEFQQRHALLAVGIVPMSAPISLSATAMSAIGDRLAVDGGDDLVLGLTGASESTERQRGRAPRLRRPEGDTRSSRASSINRETGVAYALWTSVTWVQPHSVRAATDGCRDGRAPSGGIRGWIAAGPGKAKLRIGESSPDCRPWLRL